MSKEQHHAKQQGQATQHGSPSAEHISDFLFRQRKLIFISVLVILAAVITWGVSSTMTQRQLQASSTLVYNLRKAFKEWKDARPADMLTAARDLAGQDSDEQLDLDEDTKMKRQETEKALAGQLKEIADSKHENVQAWGYWIEAQKARHLKENTDLQTALEKLIELEDKTFHNLAILQLASLFYSEGKADKAVSQWRNLADVSGPEPEQLVASIYLGNYFARKGLKDEAIRYWQQVDSLGDELLKANGLDDKESFLGGDNQVAGSWRNTLEQWKTMADNQLTFLQSDKIKLAADSYDESIKPEEPQEELETAEPAQESSGSTVSFTTDASGNIPGDT